MKPTYFILRGLKFMAFGAVFVAVAGGVVMGLWNWLVPVLFHGPVIGFWQGLGLLALCRILVGGFGRGGGWGQGRWSEKSPMHWKHRMEQRMANMSPEEKEQFKQQLKERWGKRCGNYGSFEQPKERESV